MKFYTLLLLLITLTIFQSPESYSQNKTTEIGFTEKLGEKVPLDLKFTNSDGRQLSLSQIINKPTILALVYYRCPGICSPILTEIGSVVEKLDLEPGKDFQVLTISFDHRETDSIAAKWRKEYISNTKRHLSADSWYFMVGDSVSIRTLADAVGFHFKPDGKGDYIHAGGLMVLDKEGKIARYLLGTQFLPFDVKMSVIEASKGHSIPTISKLLEYCFAYDPQGKTYVFNINKIAGSVIFLSIGIFFLVLILKGRRKKVKERS